MSSRFFFHCNLHKHNIIKILKITLKNSLKITFISLRKFKNILQWQLTKKVAAPSQREMTQEQTDGSCDVSDDCHHCNFHLEDKYGLYKHNARDGKQTLGLASFLKIPGAFQWREDSLAKHEPRTITWSIVCSSHILKFVPGTIETNWVLLLW